jgi:tight adherence protein B
MSLIMGISIIYSENKKKKDRIDKFIKSANVEEVKTNKKDEKSFFTNLLKKINEKKSSDIKKSKTEKLLVNSDIGLSIEEFNAIRIILVMVITILFYFLSKNINVIFIIPVLTWIIPTILLKMKNKRRINLFETQLGDAISMFSNSLKAGYSFLQAVNSVAKDMPDPVGNEFKILLKEISLGVNVNDALDNLMSRVNSKDLSLMIIAIKIQRETGGNLAEILNNISETIRERIKIQGEIKTLTAQGRMSGLIIGLMPPVLAFILFFINRQYISVLFTTDIGKILILFAVISEIIGLLFIKKIVNIDI